MIGRCAARPAATQAEGMDGLVVGEAVWTSDSHRSDSDFRFRCVHCKGCPARAHHIENTP
jgi:hypothetical protein